MLGTSPRLRGAFEIGLLHHLGDGNIPALAGSIILGRREKQSIREHPRACGEHASLSLSSLSYLGTSPRLRGASEGSRVRVPHRGNIPALAGSIGA